MYLSRCNKNTGITRFWGIRKRSIKNQGLCEIGGKGDKAITKVGFYTIRHVIMRADINTKC
jgi:hypothetical protein